MAGVGSDGQPVDGGNGGQNLGNVPKDDQVDEKSVEPPKGGEI